MKTKFITGSLLAFTIMANAQNTFPSSGNVGIGTTSPTNHLHIASATTNGGITITQNSGGSSALILENTTTKW